MHLKTQQSTFKMRTDFLREIFIPESAVLLQKCLNSVHPAFAWLIIPVREKGSVKTSPTTPRVKFVID